MSRLPQISGVGFIIAAIDFKVLPSGQSVANFPVAFNKDKKNESTGQWERDKGIVVRAAAWGPLAEYINDRFEAKQEIELSGELYLRAYEKKDGGGEGQSVEMTVRTAGAPMQKRDGQGGGGKDPWASAPTSSPAERW